MTVTDVIILQCRHYLDNRFGSNDGMSESTQRSSRNADDRQAKLDIANLFSASLEEGKNLISESEVADLVMQMLPSPEVERNSFFHAQFLDSPTSDSTSCKLSADIIGSDSTQSLMDGIIDIGSIDLATELGNMLNPEEKQDSSLDQHGNVRCSPVIGKVINLRFAHLDV